MKNKTAIVFGVLFLCAAFPLRGERFRWALEKDARYSIVAHTYEERFLGGDLLEAVEIRNEALVNTRNVRGGDTPAAQYRGTYRVFERNADTGAPFVQKASYSADFWRDELGRYTVDAAMLMPTLRDLPLFAEGDITRGTEWRSEGHALRDLKNYGFSLPFRIPFTAHSGYTGDVFLNGKRLAFFTVTYAFDYSVETMDIRLSIGGGQELGLRRVVGSSKQFYYWDVEARMPYYMTEDFQFIFSLENGEELEFKGKTDSNFRRAETTEARNAIRVEGVLRGAAMGEPSMSVRRSANGVVVSMENLFEGNSTMLTPEARARLLKLMERIQVIDKESIREIRVEGHADNAGNPEFAMRLSQGFAVETADFL